MKVKELIRELQQLDGLRVFSSRYVGVCYGEVISVSVNKTKINGLKEDDRVELEFTDTY